MRLRDEDGIVDNVLEIELDTTKLPRVQETDKRNLLIADAEAHGCSHVIIIDSDEYYTKKAFDKGLAEIDEHDYEMTYCQYVNYYHDYKHYLKYPFSQGMYVPFVSKTKYRHSFDCNDFPLPSDPTRRYVRSETVTGADGKQTKKWLAEYYVFPWESGVHMNHLSWCRANIIKKLQNWSSRNLFDKPQDLIEKAVYAYNQFSRKIKENEAKGITDDADVPKDAVLLFNTPGHAVEITQFPKQYIHPAVDFNTRLRKVRDYKRLLVLSMSAGDKPFNELDKVCNETWRVIDHEKYKNVDAEFWTYTDAPEGMETSVDEKHHIIYIKPYLVNGKKGNGLYQTYSKTMQALYIIDEKLKLKYDYIIRTNTSTWLNIPLLNEFLAYADDPTMFYYGKLYAAYFSAFNPFGGGQCMIWSKRNVGVLKDISGSIDETRRFEQKFFATDDNGIGSRLNARSITLKIPYKETQHTVGAKDYIGKTINEEIDFACPVHQIKTYEVSADERVKCDSEKMRYIDALWRDNNEPIETIFAKMMDKYYDAVVQVMGVSKKEWFAIPEAERWKTKFGPDTPRDEAYEYLKKRQKECGY